MKITIANNLLSVSATLNAANIRKLSKRQLARAKKRGLNVPDSAIADRKKEAATTVKAIQMLNNWRKQYTEAYENYLKLKSKGKHTEASKVRNSLKQYRAAIDQHMAAYGIIAPMVKDSYFYSPNTRFRVERDENHPHHISRLSDNGMDERIVRRRLKNTILEFEDELEDIQKQIEFLGDDNPAIEEWRARKEATEGIIRELNREVSRT